MEEAQGHQLWKGQAKSLATSAREESELVQATPDHLMMPNLKRMQMEELLGYQLSEHKWQQIIEGMGWT